jgi:hypothetical protein
MGRMFFTVKADVPAGFRPSECAFECLFRAAADQEDIISSSSEASTTEME